MRKALAPHVASGEPVYSGIGVMLETHDEAHFVAGVLDGFPAAEAGVRVGDRIVAVDGEPFLPGSSTPTGSGSATSARSRTRGGAIKTSWRLGRRAADR